MLNTTLLKTKSSFTNLLKLRLPVPFKNVSLINLSISTLPNSPRDEKNHLNTDVKHM